MKIEVTQKDIDMGVAENCNKCPIAISLKRHLKSDDIKVVVGGTPFEESEKNVMDAEPIYFEINKTRYYSNSFAKMKYAIRLFVNDFDKWGLTKNIKPFSFDLDLSKWQSMFE